MATVKWQAYNMGKKRDNGGKDTPIIWDENSSLSEHFDPATSAGDDTGPKKNSPSPKQQLRESFDDALNKTSDDAPQKNPFSKETGRTAQTPGAGELAAPGPFAG